jgi:NADH:ubiquinone oxidoreductase subunit 3 (subunit A)
MKECKIILNKTKHVNQRYYINHLHIPIYDPRLMKHRSVQVYSWKPMQLLSYTNNLAWIAVLWLILHSSVHIACTQWDVTRKKTVFVTKTERNAPFDSGPMCAQNQQMTFRISFGLYPLFGCYFQTSNDHLYPCPYELNGTTTTHKIVCYINSVTTST